MTLARSGASPNPTYASKSDRTFSVGKNIFEKKKISWVSLRSTQPTLQRAIALLTEVRSPARPTKIDSSELHYRRKPLSLQAINIPPTTSQSPTGLIVVLHGWGGNARDLASLTPSLNLPDYQFLCPDAPFPHLRVPGGRAWYNLENKDFQGLSESRQLLTEWLKSLESSTGIPLSRTILSGFSQGGAMTLDVGLTLPLAGLISLSGYLHSQPQLRGNISQPVLIVHGRQDYVVPLSSAHQAREVLSALGVSVQYREFDMGHAILPEVIVLMRSFVVEVLSKVSKTA